MEKNNYLKDVTSYLKKDKQLNIIVDNIATHPGKTGKPPIQTMTEFSSSNKQLSAHIYTRAEVSETEISENEQNDITLQGIAYLLVLNNPSNNQRKACLRRLYTLLEYLLAMLNNQRWGLNYTFPTSDITAMDLYGLSYDSDKLATSEGWDPTIQAYAKALYQTNSGGESYPKNLILWFVSWKQKLRMGNNVPL